MKFRSNNLIPVFLFFLCFFFRTYNLSDNYHFASDEGRDAIIARNIILGKSFPLTGPTTSVGHLTLGPLFYYLITPALLASGLDPLGPAVLIAIISSLASVLIFRLTKLLFHDNLSAFLSSLIFIVSPVMVEYGRWSWNPNIMPYFATLFIYSLLKYQRTGQNSWLLSMGISLAFALNSHYFAGALVVIAAVYWIREKLPISRKPFIISLAAFIVLMSPVAIYEVAKNFYNLRGFFNLASNQSSGNLLLNYPARFIFNSQLITSGLVGSGNTLFTGVILLILASVFVLGPSNTGKKLISTWCLVGLLVASIYGHETHYHYLFFLFPGFIILFAVSLAKLIKHYLVAGLLITAALLTPATISSVGQISRVHFTQPLVVKQISALVSRQSSGQAFNFAVLSNSNSELPYRYFLDMYGAKENPYSANKLLFVVCEQESQCHPRGNPNYNIALFEVKYQGQTKLTSHWVWPNGFQLLLFRPI